MSESASIDTHLQKPILGSAPSAIKTLSSALRAISQLSSRPRVVAPVNDTPRKAPSWTLARYGGGGDERGFPGRRV